MIYVNLERSVLRLRVYKLFRILMEKRYRIRRSYEWEKILVFNGSLGRIMIFNLFKGRFRF